MDVRVSVVRPLANLPLSMMPPGIPERARATHARRDALLTLIMSKRARQDSAGPFLSRLNAADIRDGGIERPGGFIEGRIYSTDPRKNQYTIDIRPSSKAKAVYLDVVIEDKLQKRLGELLIGDHLRILVKDAHILPYSGSPARLPAILRYREGITILLVSRAGIQGEKEKLLSVWPNQSEHSVVASAG
jgi:hypothetical protein